MSNIHELTAIRDNLLQQVDALNTLINASGEKPQFVTIENHGQVPVLEVQTMNSDEQMTVAIEWYGEEHAAEEITETEIVRVRLPSEIKATPTDDFDVDGQQVWTHVHRSDIFSS